MSNLLWLLATTIFGFSVSFIFSGLLKLKRPIYLLPYTILSLLFTVFYLESNQINFFNLFSKNLFWTIVTAIFISTFTVKNILSQKSSSHSKDNILFFEIIWLGIIYGLIDTILLSIIPVIIIQKIFSELNFISIILSLLSSILVTSAYHFGYSEYQNKKLIAPIIGNTIMSLGFILTGNPLAAILSHITMHIAGVFHGPETVVQLPPHYKK